jgi:hypothetical protein
VEETQSFVDVFGCLVGAFPTKYLGIPLHYNKLRREDLQTLVDQIIKRIVGWGVGTSPRKGGWSWSKLA